MLSEEEEAEEIGCEEEGSMRARFTSADKNNSIIIIILFVVIISTAVPQIIEQEADHSLLD